MTEGKEPVVVLKAACIMRDEDLDKLAKEFTNKTGLKCVAVDARIDQIVIV